MLLKGKNAIITGTNRGIGKAILEQFAQNGANVWAHARKETPEFKDYISELSNRYQVNIMPIYFDITDSNAMKEAIKDIRFSGMKVDILVNNAGIMQDAVLGMISAKLIRDTFETNVFAVIELIQLVSKIMVRQRSGSIINISSIIGVNGNKGQVVYSASKGAVISLTKAAAKELADKNIRVNAVAPGLIETDLIKSVGPDQLKHTLDNIGMKRIGTVEDVAKACIFLASDLSEYITGQVIGVDGSMLI